MYGVKFVNEITATIIVAVVASIATLGGAFITVRTQLKNDREARQLNAEKADEENELNLAQIKLEIEADLWLRLQEDFKEERGKRKELEKTVELQGGVIMQLRDTVEKQAGRIDMLEKENGRLQAENHRLKTGRGGKI